MTISAIENVQTELEAGIQLAKCQQCGCMSSALDAFAPQLQGIDSREAVDLMERIVGWKAQMKRINYTCLGCEYCYPAEAENALVAAFPEVELPTMFTCGLQIVEGEWPSVLGEYFVLDKTAPVAVVTLASVKLAEDLTHLNPFGLALVGKLETENIGIDKIIKNVISNPAVRTIIVAGVEPKGHQSGSALLALVHNGVDKNNRVIGSTAKRPVLRNVSQAEIDAFRAQVQLVDLRGCEDPVEIATRVTELASKAGDACSCRSVCPDEDTSDGQVEPVPLTLSLFAESNIADSCSDPLCSCQGEASTKPETLIAVDTEQAIMLDRAGYFVILPVVVRNVINVEHYAYDNELLRIIEGSNARDLYRAIITNGWVTELSHAAYLGKELTKAELSLRIGFKYIQDGA